MSPTFIKKMERKTSKKDRIFSTLIVFSLAFFAGLANANPRLGYDPGPDPATESGRDFLRVLNGTPNFVHVGRGLGGGRDKYRFPFGLMPYRGPTEKNTVKYLVIGQDGTHIAEAAGRPMTGGTGGRVQHLLEHLGVRNQWMSMNTSAFTIYGQYADFAPILKNGKLVWEQILPPESLLLFQDLENPTVKWRNDFIATVLRNNPDSFRGFICIGGAARDTLASFFKSQGLEVPTFVDDVAVKEYQAVLYKAAPAGGNRSFFYPIDEEGKNILSNPGEKQPKYADAKVQAEHQKRAAETARVKLATKNSAGPYRNGVLDKAQFGYNVMSLLSRGPLKNLKLLDGTEMSHPIAIATFQHPGSMSPQLEKNFRGSFAKLHALTKKGWKYAPADQGETNHAASGKPEDFDYDRKPPIPPHDFPLGKSQALIVNNSLASRSGKKLIVFGGRDRAVFNKIDEQRALKGKPSEGIRAYKGTQPWNPPIVDLNDPKSFDRGPGQEWAELFTSINVEDVFKPKGRSEMNDAQTLGRNAFNVKSSSDHGAFGFFRGTFENPEILVIADPSPTDLDALYTTRHLSGQDGQSLHGFLNGLGVEDRYLVLNTLPFDMTGASDAEWKSALEITADWRSKVLKKALRETRPKIILTIGKQAAAIAKELKSKIPVISMADQEAAFKAISKSGAFGDRKIEFTPQSLSIPRSHLPYPIQAWAGTSGSRVIRATGEGEGQYYGVVVPDWVVDIADSESDSEFKAESAYIESAAARIADQGFARLGKSTSELGGSHSEKSIADEKSNCQEPLKKGPRTRKISA